MVKKLVKHKKVTSDVATLLSAIKALKSTQHNPIAWGAVLQFLAPIIARLAIRVGLAYFSKKTGRRIHPKIRNEVAENAGEAMGDLLKKVK